MPGEGVNNVPGVALRVAGRLDRTVLQEAVAQLVRRYDALRTVFHAEDTRLTKSVRTSFPVRVEGADCPDVEAGLRELITRPFTLDGTPLLRVGLFHGPDHDSVGVAVHHLIFDGTSMSIFLEVSPPRTTRCWPATSRTPARPSRSGRSPSRSRRASPSGASTCGTSTRAAPACGSAVRRARSRPCAASSSSGRSPPRPRTWSPRCRRN